MWEVWDKFLYSKLIWPEAYDSEEEIGNIS